MSCDRNLTGEEWLEIVHGFWQLGPDPGFGPSPWISRLNVTITNVSKVFVFSVDSVPCFISMCWQDSDWISGAVVLEGLVDSILFQAWWPGSQWVSAAMVLEGLILSLGLRVLTRYRWWTTKNWWIWSKCCFNVFLTLREYCVFGIWHCAFFVDLVQSL